MVQTEKCFNWWKSKRASWKIHSHMMQPLEPTLSCHIRISLRLWWRGSNPYQSWLVQFYLHLPNGSNCSSKQYPILICKLLEVIFLTTYTLSSRVPLPYFSTRPESMVKVEPWSGIISVGHLYTWMSVSSHLALGRFTPALKSTKKQSTETHTPLAQADISPNLQRINTQPRIHRPLNQLVPNDLDKAYT